MVSELFHSQLLRYGISFFLFFFNKEVIVIFISLLLLVLIVKRFGSLLKKKALYIEGITRWCEDMNFIFEWQNNILRTSAARE